MAESGLWGSAVETLVAVSTSVPSERWPRGSAHREGPRGAVRPLGWAQGTVGPSGLCSPRQRLGGVRGRGTAAPPRVAVGADAARGADQRGLHADRWHCRVPAGRDGAVWDPTLKGLRIGAPRATEQQRDSTWAPRAAAHPAPPPASALHPSRSPSPSRPRRSQCRSVLPGGLRPPPLPSQPPPLVNPFCPRWDEGREEPHGASPANAGQGRQRPPPPPAPPPRSGRGHPQRRRWGGGFGRNLRAGPRGEAVPRSPASAPRGRPSPAPQEEGKRRRKRKRKSRGAAALQWVRARGAG